MHIVLKACLVLVITSWFLALSPGTPVEADAFVFSGKVFSGDIGDESAPISNVTLQLFGSNDPNYLTGTVLDTAVTDGVGWYELETPGDTYAYYHIVKYDPPSYTIVGATSIDGTVIWGYWIRFASPLSGKTLTGNKFWDKPGIQFQGHVFSGALGVETTPIGNVTLHLYGSSTSDLSDAVLIDSMPTNEYGWYALGVTNDIFNYYTIIEYDLGFYSSVGATSVGGVIVDSNTIQYASPAFGKTVTGNKFWDTPGVSDYVFQGRVYSGLPGQESHPLTGVAVRLYVSNDPYPTTGGILVDWMVTDATGWYQLGTSHNFNYYRVEEEDPAGYLSTGATTVDGAVRANNIIEYTGPLAGKTLTGNKFWDRGAFLGFMPIILRQ
jgi:hypothetical protein